MIVNANKLTSIINKSYLVLSFFFASLIEFLFILPFFDNSYIPSVSIPQKTGETSIPYCPSPYRPYGINSDNENTSLSGCFV